MDNNILPKNESFKSFPRTKKQPYKQVKYKDDYAPPVFKDKVTTLRRSEQLTDRQGQRPDHQGQQTNRQERRTDHHPYTVWTASKPFKFKPSNGGSTLLPSSIQAEPSKGLIDKPLKNNITSPLSSKDERLRAYHARLDLMQSILHPQQEDLDWQVETITE